MRTFIISVVVLLALMMCGCGTAPATLGDASDAQTDAQDVQADAQE